MVFVFTREIDVRSLLIYIEFSVTYVAISEVDIFWPM